MMKLEDLAMITAVADAGSIREAARHLGVRKSVVSERLVELERELGGRLKRFPFLSNRENALGF